MLGYSFLAALGYKNYANLSVIVASLAHIFGLFLISILDLISVPNILIMIASTESIVLIIRIHGINKHDLWSLSTYSNPSIK